MMFKDFRDKIVDIVESNIRKTNLSDKSICMLMRTLHFSVPLVTTTILLIGSDWWFKAMIVFNIFVFFLFFIFDGCILSKLEHRFTEDEFTVIDPFLELIKVELNNENRRIYSLYSSIMGFILTFGLYYVRFILPAKFITSTLAPAAPEAIIDEQTTIM
jgi:hypothetical protein